MASGTSECRRCWVSVATPSPWSCPTSGGLYPSAIVTYRGTKVGKVGSVHLSENGGVAAVLSLQSGIDIPSNLTAQVHSQSALGEQYVALLPRDGSAAPLKDGDVIAMDDTSVPPPSIRCSTKQTAVCRRSRTTT